DVEQLHAHANGQHRNLHLDGQLGETTIEVFAAIRHGAGGRVLVESEPHRVEIELATGQHDAVKVLENLTQIIVFRTGEQRERHTAGTGNAVVVTGVHPAKSEGILLLVLGTEIRIDADDRFGGLHL